MPKPNVELAPEYTPRRVEGNLRDIEAVATQRNCTCTTEQRAGVVPADGTCDTVTCVPCAARIVINSITTFKFPEGW